MDVGADGRLVLYFVKDGLQLPFQYTFKTRERDLKLKQVDIHQIALNTTKKLTTPILLIS